MKKPEAFTLKLDDPKPQTIKNMNTHIFMTRRARNLPLSALNRRRPRSPWITAARVACVTVAVAWVLALAALVAFVLTR